MTRDFAIVTVGELWILRSASKKWVCQTRYFVIMCMLLHCCHGEVMWPKSVTHIHRPRRSRALEHSAHAQLTIDNSGYYQQ